MALKFQINKIPVTIYPNFLIIVLLLSINRLSQPAYLLSWFIVVILSILLHELGHALAARYFGGSPSIELRGIAGLTYLASDKLKPLPNIIISIAGPLVGIVTGLLFLLIAARINITSPVLRVALGDLIWVNLYWSLANLLPMLPLDGGNISLVLFTKFFGHNGRLIANILSLAIAIPLAIYMAVTNNIYLVILIAYLALFNIQQFTFFRKRGTDARFTAELGQGYRLLQQKNPEAAIALGHELLNKIENPQVKQEVWQFLSRACFQKQDFDAALQAMEQVVKKSNDDEKLLGFIYYYREDFTRACEHFGKAVFAQDAEGIATPYLIALMKSGQLTKAAELATGFIQHQIQPQLLEHLANALYQARQWTQALSLYATLFYKQKSPTAAYQAACTQLQLGDERRALEWLKKAVQAGFTDARSLQQEALWQPLQDNPRFRDLVQQAAARISG